MPMSDEKLAQIRRKQEQFRDALIEVTQLWTRELDEASALAVGCKIGLEPVLVSEFLQYWVNMGEGDASWLEVAAQIQTHAPSNFEPARPSNAAIDSAATKVFLSYSHKDTKWVERLREHFRAVAGDTGLDIFDDSLIAPGEKWFERLEREMSSAGVAILLVSPSFLASNFVRREEVPRLLAKRSKEGMVLYPLLIRDCAFAAVPWLASIQVRPRDARPVSAMRSAQIDSCFAGVVREVLELLQTGDSAAAKQNAVSSPQNSGHSSPKVVFEKLEQLIAVFSLLNWRSADQRPPLIKEDSEWGGKSYTYDISMPWGSAGLTEPGELFSHFSQETSQRDIDGNEFQGYSLAPNEDFWYEFRWVSLFGYELEIRISPDRGSAAYALRDEIEASNRSTMRSELGDQFAFDIPLYVVRISGMRRANYIDFVASGGQLLHLSNGSVDIDRQWVVYIGDAQPINLGGLKKFILIALRELGCQGESLEQAVQAFERLWIQSEPRSLNIVLNKLCAETDMTALTSFLGKAGNAA